MNKTLYINISGTLDKMHRINGTTWIVYAGTLYGLTPLSIFGFFMNMIAYFILRKKPFQSSTVFKYLRYNVLNSLIICLILVTKFTTVQYNFDFTNSYGFMFYGSYIFAPFLSIFYLNGNLLDILITLDRILTIRPIRIIHKIIKYNYLWIGLFIFSTIINIPNFFITEPDCTEIILNSKIRIKNYFVKQSDFSSSMLCKILIFLIYFIRDVLTLFIKIGLNIVCVIFIKKYFNKLCKDSERRFDTPTEDELNTKKAYMTEIDRNLTYIAITMSVLSSIENLFFIFTHVYLTYDFNITGLELYFFSNFIIAIKHSSNLMILYSFNNVFNEELRKVY